MEELFPKSADAENSHSILDDRVDNFDDIDDNDDDDNVISLDKIKAGARIDDYDDMSEAGAPRPPSADRHLRLAQEVKPQEPFQPGSSPVHLLNRYMVRIFFQYNLLIIFILFVVFFFLIFCKFLCIRS